MQTQHLFKRIFPPLFALVLVMLWNVTSAIAQEKVDLNTPPKAEEQSTYTLAVVRINGGSISGYYVVYANDQAIRVDIQAQNEWSKTIRGQGFYLNVRGGEPLSTLVSLEVKVLKDGNEILSGGVTGSGAWASIDAADWDPKRFIQTPSGRPTGVQPRGKLATTWGRLSAIGENLASVKFQPILCIAKRSGLRSKLREAIITFHALSLPQKGR